MFISFFFYIKFTLILLHKYFFCIMFKIHIYQQMFLTNHFYVWENATQRLWLYLVRLLLFYFLWSAQTQMCRQKRACMDGHRQIKESFACTFVKAHVLTATPHLQQDPSCSFDSNVSLFKCWGDCYVKFAFVQLQFYMWKNFFLLSGTSQVK